MQRFVVSWHARDEECHLTIRDNEGVLLTLHLSLDEFTDLLAAMQAAESRRTNVTA